MTASPAPQPVRDVDAEQEVDLASAWGRLTARWWLPVIGLVAGAVVGLALALSGSDVYQAKTLIYLGQPFAPLGGGQITSLATNPKTVSAIVHSEAAVKDAADASDMPVARLRSSISVKDIIAPGQTRGTNPLVEIGVKASRRHKAEVAADMLARHVVSIVSVFVVDKVKLLQQQVNVAKAQLDAVNQRITTAQQQQAALTQDKSLSPELRVVSILNLNSVIATADARRTALQEQLYDSQQLLILANSVEKSRVVEPASAAKSTARSNRTALVVGGLVGLLLGAIAALIVEPIVARRRLASAG
jgi:uncharacterized protein involved in exopolysaccharide biosynthesis